MGLLYKKAKGVCHNKHCYWESNFEKDSLVLTMGHPSEHHGEKIISLNNSSVVLAMFTKWGIGIYLHKNT